MNFVIKLTFFCLFIALASFSYVEGKCSSDADCKVNECCVIMRTLIFSQDGVCKPRPMKGQSCDPINLLKEVHGVCPCAEGLKCEPAKNIDIDGKLVLSTNYLCKEVQEPEVTEEPTEVTDGQEVTVTEELETEEPETEVPE